MTTTTPEVSRVVPRKRKPRPLDDGAPPPPPPDEVSDERPLIRIGPDLARVASQAVKALAPERDIFQRDGSLFQVVREPLRGEDGSIGWERGTPRLRQLPMSTLRERLSAVARWERYDRREEDWVQCLPPDPAVRAVLDRGTWRGVQPVVGIVEAPSLRADGTVIEVPGYDTTTGFLFAPACDFPPVPESPTQADAAAALAALAEVFVDFPYRGAADMAVPLAAILTVIARPAIRGSVPAFLFDASTRGSGKTLQTDAVAVIGTGRSAARMNYPGGKHADEELEKVLASHAIAATSLITFDNIAGGFGGGPLDRCITAEDAVQLRVLGRSEIQTLRWRSVLLGSGNNIVVRGDTTRRVLVSRLEPAEENPETRQNFRHSPLLAWIRSERARLVVAALTILRAFFLAGRPRCGCATWGSFEAWSELIPPAIVWAGGADPMLSRPREDGEHDPEKGALIALLGGLKRLDPGTGLTAKGMIDALYTRDRMRGEAPPDGFDDMREAIEALVPVRPREAPNPTSLGYKLRAFRGRVVGARRLDGRVGRAGSMIWRVIESGAPDGPAAVAPEPSADPRCVFDGCTCRPCGHCGHCTDPLRPHGPGVCCC